MSITKSGSYDGGNQGGWDGIGMSSKSRGWICMGMLAQISWLIRLGVHWVTDRCVQTQPIYRHQPAVS